MNTGNDRQKIYSALADISNASQQERLTYGVFVRDLRQKLGMTQEELATAAGVSVRSIRNIESQSNAGQSGKLIQIFRALGVELEHSDWSEDTQKYLAMLAPLIERLSPTRRLSTMSEVLDLLAGAIEKQAQESEDVDARIAAAIAAVNNPDGYALAAVEEDEDWQARQEAEQELP